jgi:branched-chain amino acid transport system ATP-binding protein
MLTISGINTFRGPAQVLFDVSLELGEGEVVCLVGRNGVGKTTCLHSINGLSPPRTGSVRFDGREIAGLPPFQIARLGIGYAPGDRRIFPDLTVEENLEIAMRKGSDGRYVRMLPWAYETFPLLGELRRKLGWQLSGGQQHVLTFARTLMGGPRSVLVDEPTEGLSPVAVRHLRAIIRSLKETGLTMLIAAPDMRFAMAVADRIYVMSRGRIVYAGTVDEVRRDEATVRTHFVV